MARIRSIKPELPQSESMGNVSREARLTFILLWTLSDDEGRLRGNSRMLASLLFPYDDDAPHLIDGWLNELENEGCIQPYKIAGQSYVQICNWLIHQKIDKPSKSKIPEFEKPREDSRNVVGGSRIKDQGSEEGKGSVAPNGAVNPESDDSVIDLLGSTENRSVTPKSGESSAIPQCPVGSIVNAYHELMPLNPRVKVLSDSRKKAIAARWREAAVLTCKPFGYATSEQGVEAWRNFFMVCAASKFLTGQAQPQPGKPPFVADIDFLVSPSGFTSCLENKYHREAA